ncbi:MAG: SpoIIE family protein phosphatase [Candidatus Poribacteria bacterium]
MNSEDMSNSELTEDALARRVYHLNMLYELNQEISILRNVQDVLESSLLYIIGIFGLRNGLIAIYKENYTFPDKIIFRGISEDDAIKWLHRMEPHVNQPLTHKVFTIHDGAFSLTSLFDELNFYISLPLEIDENMRGLIVLGKKLSEKAFDQYDIELLSTIAINIQNILSNVLLIEALNKSVIKETRIRNVFQKYAPQSIVDEVLNPSNAELLLGESQEVRSMFEKMIIRLEEKHTLEQDLNLANEVQNYLLPYSPPKVPGIEIAAISIPARGVCGDFYDFIPLNTYEMIISLADVSGKGMSAAIVAAMLQSATRMCIGNYCPITAILSILNSFLYRHTDTNRYATMFFGKLDAQGKTFTYSNAGHPPAILYRDGEIKLLETGGLAIGSFEYSNYDQDVVYLKPKDILFIYSDGVTDAGATIESVSFDDSFGQKRLEEVVMANADLEPNLILESISNEITNYASGNSQFDDITMIIMKVHY